MWNNFFDQILKNRIPFVINRDTLNIALRENKTRVEIVHLLNVYTVSHRNFLTRLFS